MARNAEHAGTAREQMFSDGFTDSARMASDDGGRFIGVDHLVRRGFPWAEDAEDTILILSSEATKDLGKASSRTNTVTSRTNTDKERESLLLS